MKTLGKEETAGTDNQSALSLSIYVCALSSCNNVDTTTHNQQPSRLTPTGSGRGEKRGRGVPGSGDSWAKPNQVGANASHQQSPPSPQSPSPQSPSPPVPQSHKWVRVRTCQDIMWVFCALTGHLTGERIERKDGCLDACKGFTRAGEST